MMSISLIIDDEGHHGYARGPNGGSEGPFHDGS